MWRLSALAVLDGVLVSTATLGIATLPCLLGHVAVTTLGLVMWLRGGRSLGFFGAVAGMTGPVALLVALHIGRPVVQRMADGSDPEDALPTPLPVFSPLSGARMLDGRVHPCEPDDVGSLVTILRHGAVADRRRALETAVRGFRPALVPLLAIALTDGDQTIRALAAAASARIAQNLSTTCAQLEAQVARGDDPVAVRALAALFADHARHNVLLSDSQRNRLRDDALALMKRMGDAASPQRGHPGDPMLIEALWAAGKYESIDRLVAANPMTHSWWHQEACE